ncbi:MAG: aspartate aminotransferase family protein [Candidatus Hydrogenedentes bacterium]|nr:aspartate aminotransferase family protein [Candidatus Hydrogenedentota bacterium]
MKTDEIKSLTEAHIINTYGSRSIAFVRGEGTKLWDAEGNEYLDFFGGIAVAALGHCHPKVTAAITQQAATLVHVSNLYLTQPCAELASLLCKHSFADKWFFSNCGATAIEAAIKLARRYWAQQGTPKPVIVSMQQSFHGRTMAAITATGQPKYHEGFAPMLPGIVHVPFNDHAELMKALTPEVGAVLLEPVQGEGGIRVADTEYLKSVRALCDARNVLLIFDEIQCGMGRTGTLFAHEQYGVTPDIVALAKALANGMPIGAMGCTEKVASGFSVGSHASTFGGNPVCTAAAKATVEAMLEPGFLDRVKQTGAYFMDKLNGLKAKHDSIVEVRGKGLMIGVELKNAVAPVVAKMLDARVVCGPAGLNVLRFVPPLIVTKEQVEHVVATLDRVLGAN